MWALAVAIYAGCKWLTWHRTPKSGASLGKQFGYLLAWPGMDAGAFLDPCPSPPPTRPSVHEWVFAGGNFAAGIALAFGAARMVGDRAYLVGWVGMTGIVMILHFGTFHLLSCAWRSAGVDAKPLMNWPMSSISVGEFWGRRWNTAFRDLTHRFLFRPLTARVGPHWALALGFVCSGLVHDLVISVPAGGGYGSPTMFFVIQAGALFLERSAFGGRIGLGRGLRGWLFTMLVLLTPAFLLLHPPFVEEVILPFLRALRAIQ